MNIYQKLIEVQKGVSYLQKDNKGYQFQYVSSAQTLASVREKMDELGLLLTVEIAAHATSEKATKHEGSQIFTELELIFTWVNAEKPEESIVCPFYAQGLDSGEKGVGKALTYGEKYFLLKFFHIATDKDDPDAHQAKYGTDNGKNDPEDKPPRKKQNPPPSGESEPPPSEDKPKFDRASALKDTEEWLLEMAGGGEERFGVLLRQVSEYTPKTGEGSKYVLNREHLQRVSDKWLNIIVHKAEERYNEFKASE